MDVVGQPLVTLPSDNGNSSQVTCSPTLDSQDLDLHLSEDSSSLQFPQLAFNIVADKVLPDVDNSESSQELIVLNEIVFQHGASNLTTVKVEHMKTEQLSHDEIVTTLEYKKKLLEEIKSEVFNL